MAELLNDGFPFTPSQGHDLGINEALLRRHLVEGAIRREFRGVYVDARVPDSRQARLRALRLVNPGGAIACNETAAWLHGINVFHREIDTCLSHRSWSNTLTRRWSALGPADGKRSSTVTTSISSMVCT